MSVQLVANVSPAVVKGRHFNCWTYSHPSQDYLEGWIIKLGVVAQPNSSAAPKDQRPGDIRGKVCGSTGFPPCLLSSHVCQPGLPKQTAAGLRDDPDRPALVRNGPNMFRFLKRKPKGDSVFQLFFSSGFPERQEPAFPAPLFEQPKGCGADTEGRTPQATQADRSMRCFQKPKRFHDSVVVRMFYLLYFLPDLLYLPCKRPGAPRCLRIWNVKLEGRKFRNEAWRLV